MALSHILTPGVKADGYLALGRSKSGTLFRKQILKAGDLIHPTTKQKIAIDADFRSKLARNFEDGVCDIVQVPLANDANEHVEDPDRNIGEVIGIDANDDGVWVTIDARSEGAAEKLGSTYLGASAMLALDYTDTQTGEQVGPTLLHVAVTNRPYVTGLEGFEQILAATSDGVPDEDMVLLTESESEEGDQPMDLEALKALAEEHGIDLSELSQAPEASDEQLATLQASVDELAAAKTKEILSAALGEKAEGEEPAVPEGVDAEVAAILSAHTEQVAKLSASVESLVGDAVANEVDDYIKAGRLLPAKRDDYIALANKDMDTFRSIVPDTPIVALSKEKGADIPDGDLTSKTLSEEERSAEIARLTGSQPQWFGLTGKDA